MVSPIERDRPSIKAATIPDRAAGNTTRSDVCHFLAPSPYDASRSDRGTACMASSETEDTRGMIKIPTPMPAAIRLDCWVVSQMLRRMSGVMNRRAK